VNVERLAPSHLIYIPARAGPPGVAPGGPARASTAARPRAACGIGTRASEVGWKVFLWRVIHDDDLRSPSGDYWEAADDLAYMFPMLEMATNSHAFYLDDINYVYNHDNPLCNSTCKPDVLKRCAQLIRAKQSYSPLVRSS